MNDFNYTGSELELFAHAQNWKHYWAKQVAPYLGKKIIDVGAGIGSNLELLWQPNASWLCIEPDELQASQAAQMVEQLGAGQTSRVVHGTLSQLDANDKADTILYLDVLEHIEEDKAELEEAVKHLLPGGHLIILAPAQQWLFSPFDEAIGHFRRYTRQSLSQVVPSGLTQKQMHYLDSVGLIASAMNKMILKSSLPSPAQIAFWDRGLVPLSRILDPLLRYRYGKSILGVWQKGEQS